MTLMTPQELADHVGERIMCPHVYAMERAAFYEAKARRSFARVLSATREAVYHVGSDPYVWHSVADLIDANCADVGQGSAPKPASVYGSACNSGKSGPESA